VNIEKPCVTEPIISLSSHMSINLREISLLFEKENAFSVLCQTPNLAGMAGGSAFSSDTKTNKVVHSASNQGFKGLENGWNANR
jgi:hypothetical protein